MLVSLLCDIILKNSCLFKLLLILKLYFLQLMPNNFNYTLNKGEYFSLYIKFSLIVKELSVSIDDKFIKFSYLSHKIF
jgi:hypothetical protein